MIYFMKISNNKSQNSNKFQYTISKQDNQFGHLNFEFAIPVPRMQ